MMSSLRRSPSSNPQINGGDVDDQTIVFAENTKSSDDQTLSTAVFSIVFNVIRNFYPPTSSLRKNVFTDHNTSHEFEHPIHRLSESDICDMLSRIEIPFDWDKSLFWKNQRSQSSAPTPLSGVEDMAARVSEFACSAARQGLKNISMLVTIEKRIVVGERDFETMCLIRQVEDELGSCRFVMSRTLEHERRMETSTSVLPSRTLVDFRRSLTRQIINLRLRRLEAAADDIRADFRSSPAAKSALDALKRLRYDGKSDDHDDQSTLTCPVCMEDVEIGSHVTRMPCSHMFHWSCILKWLNERQTCPICRFNLLTNNV